MNRLKIILPVLLTLACFAPAIAGDDHAGKMKATNKICPVTQEAIGADAVVVMHGDRAVALCCKMCRKEWGKLTAAQRDAKLAKLGAAKKTAAPRSDAMGDPYTLGTCPVSGKALGGMGKPVVKTYEGREVRFCCGGCIGRFEKSRDTYFMKIDDLIIEDQEERYPLQTCLVSGGKLGSMGDPVDVVIANRLYRLCCEGCRKKLVANLATHRATLDAAVVRKQSAAYPMKTCVVSGKKLGSMGKAPELVLAGRLVRLCCKGCESALRKAPATYIAKLDSAAKHAASKKPAKDGGDHKHKHD